MDLVLSHSRDHRPFKKYKKGKINSRVSPTSVFECVETLKLSYKCLKNVMKLGCKSISKNTCLVNLGSKWTRD